MTLIKICGLRDPATALAAAEAGADFVGLVFAESKRKITPQQCYDVVEALKAKRTQGRDAEFDGPARGDVSARSWFGVWADAIEQSAARWRPLIVGVFADMPADEVNDIAQAAGLDLIQLSGAENDAYLARMHLPVIRTVHVREQMTSFDIADAAVPGASAAIHLDTGAGNARGGTGEAFDWAVASEVAERTPFMLAGGLTQENVAAAIEQVHPWAIDVSTGVETNGIKDIDKIRALIRAAKGVRLER